MAEHTPTPWEVQPLDTGGFKIVPKDDPSFKICRIENSITYLMAFDDAAEPDATLIVEAVNNHDRLTRENEALREALDVARRYVDAVVVNTPDKKKRRNYSDCLRIIDDALALKEPGQ